VPVSVSEIGHPPSRQPGRLPHNPSQLIALPFVVQASRLHTRSRDGRTTKKKAGGKTRRPNGSLIESAT